MRQDHHCPWINNCVGHFNYGHFVRFLFYVDVACSYHLAMMVRRVYHNLTISYWVSTLHVYLTHSLKPFQDSIPAVEFVLILLNFVTCIPVLLSVGAFRQVFNCFLSSRSNRPFAVYSTFWESWTTQPRLKAGRRIKSLLWSGEGGFRMSSFHMSVIVNIPWYPAHSFS